MDQAGDSSATPSDGGAAFIEPEPTSHSVGPKGMTQDAITKPISPGPAQLAMSTPLVSAKGDDDLMSQPATGVSLPGVDEVNGEWKQQVGAAKVAWGKLTEDELIETEGRVQKLTGLVQERYGLTYDAADKQVKGFFENHPS